MEEQYKNRELDEKFLDIKDSLTRIETQTRQTNGRVTKLERWKYIGMGATSVLTIIVVPILAWALYVLVNLQSQINQGVSQALSSYNIQVK